MVVHLLLILFTLRETRHSW